MSGTALVLLDAVTGNTEGVKKTLGSGGDRYVFISGGFGGGTLTLQVESPNNEGTWIPISEGIFTEPQAWVLLGVYDNLTIRAVLTDATASTLTVEISK